eukprot:6020011-Amphidinium_carterae.1
MVLPDTPSLAREPLALPLPVALADGHEVLRQVAHEDWVQPISKSESLVSKVRPVQPGPIWVQASMSFCACIGQDIGLTIAMQIIGGYPTDVHICL